MELNSELVNGVELLPIVEDGKGVGILATAVMPFAFVRLWQVASKSNLRTAIVFEEFVEDSCGTRHDDGDDDESDDYDQKSQHSASGGGRVRGSRCFGCCGRTAIRDTITATLVMMMVMMMMTGTWTVHRAQLELYQHHMIAETHTKIKRSFTAKKIVNLRIIE
uniref:Uncharacterized protein n=1 Tax=Glossina brevipalpis TaxID=37001 RepID=A0A1A9X5D8_9MUSC